MLPGQTQEGLDELSAAIPIAEIGNIRKMGKVIGMIYAENNYPTLSQAAKESLLPILIDQPVVQSAAQYDPLQRKFIAVAWLLGASLRQLGRKFNKAAPTIGQNLDRELRAFPDRNVVRLAQPGTMEAWRLEGLHRAFYKLATGNEQAMRDLAPLDIAKAMKEMPLDTSADNDD